jgi:hypothetical protein
MMAVLLTVPSTPSAAKMRRLRGLFRRAMVRWTPKIFAAIWLMSRLVASSPVTAATTSARRQPAASRSEGREPSPRMTASPSSRSRRSSLAGSFSITVTSCP